ncbi:ribulose-phosphate 3-epimerase [Thermoplasmatota archaeon]
MKKFVIPAIIAKNQEELDLGIKKVQNFSKIIQLDFMDGVFVPNHSIDFDFKIPKINCFFEAHLMLKNPLDWIVKNFSKVDMILTHYEALSNPQKVIDFVRNEGKKIGFVLNPETSVDELFDYLDQLDQILIMTVNPGFYGSPFIPEIVKKISELREIAPKLDIEVDGGITDKTIDIVDEAGANMFVSGSYILKSKNIKQAFDRLNKILA